MSRGGHGLEPIPLTLHLCCMLTALAQGLGANAAEVQRGLWIGYRGDQNQIPGSAKYKWPDLPRGLGVFFSLASSGASLI